MYCIKCGTKLPPIAKFCRGCGAKINKNEQQISEEKKSAKRAKSYWARLFHSRINRTEYFFGPFLIFIPFFIILIVVEDLNNAIGGLLVLAAYIYFFIYNISLTIRRFHDLGYNSTYMLFFFIPFANIYYYILLLTNKGEAGENDYGEASSSVFSVAKIFGFK